MLWILDIKFYILRSFRCYILKAIFAVTSGGSWIFTTWLVCDPVYPGYSTYDLNLV